MHATPDATKLSTVVAGEAEVDPTKTMIVFAGRRGEHTERLVRYIVVL